MERLTARRVFEFKPSTFREKPRQKRGTSKVPSQQVWPQHDGRRRLTVYRYISNAVCWIGCRRREGPKRTELFLTAFVRDEIDDVCRFR